MNKYLVKYNRSGEVTELEVKAETNYGAILSGLGVMAKKYGVSKSSLILYFSTENLNVEAKLII